MPFALENNVYYAVVKEVFYMHLLSLIHRLLTLFWPVEIHDES